MANADDLYGASAFATLADHLRQGGGHALVGYRLANTLLGDRPVNRALCEVDADGNITGIVEGAVHVGDGELTWRPIGASDDDARPMKGDEPVSMNLWGFTPAILPVLERRLRPASKPAAASLRERNCSCPTWSASTSSQPVAIWT